MQDTTNTASQPTSNGAKPVRAKPKLTRPDALCKLLIRKSGATTAQIQAAFGWQPHTARAALSRLRMTGVTVTRSDEPRGAVYRIATPEVAQ